MDGQHTCIGSVSGTLIVPLSSRIVGHMLTEVNFVVPTLGGFWFGIGMFTIFMAMLSYLPDAYPSVAATTIAGNCLMRAILAAAFPVFMIPYYEALGAGVASSILGVVGILFIPWPIILYYRGKNLRMKSKNARKDI